MIPVVFAPAETDFSTYGLGSLPDCMNCEVTEERNGQYECYIRYPLSGRNFGLIQKEMIIRVKPNDTDDEQAFRVYRVTKPIDGVVRVYAQHISYDLLTVPVMPFSVESRSASLLLSQLVGHDSRFTSWTDYDEAKPFTVTVPKSVRACLGGSEGSMLSKWHGEYEWDNFLVKFHSSRGQKTGVVIEYGKNLTNIEQDENNSAVYTDLLPYAVYTDDQQNSHVVTLPEETLPIAESELVKPKTLILDLSDAFGENEEVTADALRAKAQQYIAANPLGVTTPTVKIAFEPLWQAAGFPAVLERLRLCDTVTVRYTQLGIDVTAKVVKTVYDALREKFISITLGSEQSSMVTAVSDIQKEIGKVQESIGHFPKLLQTAIDHATDLITGQVGGFVVINGNENGQPYELLILDTPDINTAVNVWRWNSGGLGFSANGYNGPYTTAITADGKIVADFITSGTLVANIIRAGVIASQDNSSWWDLETGEVYLKSYATTADIETLTQKNAEFQASVDGLTSYVSAITTQVENVYDELGNESQRVTAAEQKISQLQQTVDGITMNFQDQFVGGINHILNSCGLNGLTDDWVRSGTVTIDASTDVQNNTTSDSAFVIGESSSLKQTIHGAVPGSSYVLSLRAKKDTADYQSYVRVQYNGNKYAYAFNLKTTFGWTEYSVVIPDVQDSTLIVHCYNRSGKLYVSDLMLAEGTAVHKWTPAPNEIYTAEVKIDRRGIEVSNAASSQRTVITNTEFAGYYNEEVIFTLNKDETQTKKTTVDGELTVGKTKFVPMSTASEGLNIVILD